jgi:hypothetical protein
MSHIRHKDSALAEFHRTLAEKNHWNLSQFVEKIQQEALKAQDGIVDFKPFRVGQDYVVAMLYGRKPLSRRLLTAVAAALEITREDYIRQKDAFFSSQKAAAKKSVLPIDFWPHFAWRSPKTAPRQIAARLYGLSKTGLRSTFSVTPGKWEPPAGFSNYGLLRDQAWQEFAKGFVRMKKEPPNPKPIWHVGKIKSLKDSSVELEVCQADYRDILVTGSYQGLEHSIRTDFNVKCTVKQWLASHWKPGDLTEPVLPGARQLVVNLMVITNDGFAVLSRQGADNPDSSGSWVTSTSTVVNPKKDSDSKQLPDLMRAASRGCKEEMGLNTDCATVRWLSVAAGLKYGSITFFGMLQSNWSRQEITESVARNVGKAKRDPTFVCEVVEVDFLKISSEAIAQRLKSCDYRPYLELGLALLLWYGGQAEFLDGVNSQTVLT